jgi:cell division protein FtsI (penicillin-binding protein 3)
VSRSIPYKSSPLLASRTPVWRSKLVVGFLALGFVGLAARAAYIQVVSNDFFQRQGSARFARTLELPASRGRILDRNGLVLASSVLASSVWAIPEDVEPKAKQLEQLAHLLQMPLSDLNKKLQVDDKSFVLIKRQVDESVGRQIQELKVAGIHLRADYKRQYPESEAAAHVVGFTNVEDLGQEGVELAFNKTLAGKKGARRVIKDRLGSVVEVLGDTMSPVDGQDLVLSLDSKIQFFAFQKLRDAVRQHKARAGSVVVLDAQSGEVLALANYPSYAPGQRHNLSGEQLRNRALTDTFEPGSSMKPFVAALALQKGLVRPDTTIQTAPGKLTITGSTISDAHAYGLLTVNEIIQKSSNVGTVKMAMQMQPREMWEIFSAVGFGQKPQLPFPGTVSGRLRAYKSWRPIEQATMSYGYGLSCSLFQLAQAYTLFAREGDVAPVTLLKATEPAVGVRVIDARHVFEVRHMLHQVTQQGGTAPKAQTIGYSVGGKTGTAHKQEGRGYASKKYRSFFVGLAPVEQPRIVVAVMIDEPTAGQYFGGAVAAPVFSEVVQQSLRMLGIQPDMAVKPQIVAQAAEESF